MRPLTHSNMSVFKNCHRMYYFKVVQGLAGKNRRAALGDGSAIHKGIETGSVAEALALFDGIYPSNQSEAEALETRKAFIEGAITGYLKRFPDPPEARHEIRFDLPIINPATKAVSKTFRLAGKIDGLEKRGNKWFLVEIKTSGQLNKAYIDRLPLDTQVTTYVYALTRMGYDIGGVVYRVIRKPTIKPRQNETNGEYRQRLIRDYQERQDFYFYEEPLYRSKADLDEFEAELWAITQDVLSAERLGWWYKNTSRCAEYGGCEFLPLCRGEAGAEIFYETVGPNPELDKEAPDNGDAA